MQGLERFPSLAAIECAPRSAKRAWKHRHGQHLESDTAELIRVCCAKLGEAGDLQTYSSFFAIAHQPLVSVDDGHRIVAANQAAAQLFGSAVDELVGSSLAERVHPEDRERVIAAWTAPTELQTPAELSCRIADARGSFQQVTLRFVRDAGSGHLVISCQEASAPGSQASASDSQATSLEDMRAQRDDARRRLAAVLDTLHDIVLMTDEDGVTTGMNRPPSGLSVDDIIGVPMLSFAAPEEQAPMRGRYAEVRATGKLLAYETVAKYPDGTMESFTSRLGPIMDGDRSVGVVLITRNVTDERRLEEAKRYAEQQMRESMVQLERSNRELERFASVASHDLQEPLRKIQAFGDRLRDRFKDELPETGRDYLERIRGAALRMQGLINDLLMFSRLSAREQVYSRVNLTKVARAVLSDLEVRIEETGGTVKLGDLPTLDADPVHMRQLLQNMIGNALKFARAEVPPVVDITAEVVTVPDRVGEVLRLVIADNGIGIEPRYHDRIFGIFERLHGRGKYEGTGVGLAVCHKIVEQHHGSITVGSVVGEGTTFTIMLPMKQPERSQKT